MFYTGAAALSLSSAGSVFGSMSDGVDSDGGTFSDGYDSPGFDSLGFEKLPAPPKG